MRQSLERAFAEDHSIDNAAVELKTLRMASNVDLKRVRESVVAAIVEKIQVVQGDATAQRKEIVSIVQRWGPLIDKIGGVDPVETVEVLQVCCYFCAHEYSSTNHFRQYHCARSTHLPLFGQILASLYQEDIVEEDDIRAWHAKSIAKGADLKPGQLLDGVKHCWTVAGKMIEQFDAQESSEEESEDGSEESNE